MTTHQSPPGTQDWLPGPDGASAARVIERARGDLRRRRLPRDDRAGDRGHRPLRPHERRGLRRRHEGDVLFRDRGDRDISLRPELTAGARPRVPPARHGDAAAAGQAYSIGNAYRYNRMQRGRLREFVQFDAEAIGSADPAVDAEIIALEMRWLTSVGMDGLELEINSIDTPAARRVRGGAARVHRRARERAVGDVLRLRDINPLRAFDTKDEARAVLAAAPKITDRLSPRQQSTSRAVRAFLDARGIAYRVEPTLVRGLDYYTHTAWEIEWPPTRRAVHRLRRRALRRLGRVLGGPPTPGIGFARRHRAHRAGAAGPGGRALVAGRARPVRPDRRSTEARPRLHALLDELRLAGVRCRGRPGRSRAQGPAEHADRLGAARRPVRARGVGGRYGSAPRPHPRRHRDGRPSTTSCAPSSKGSPERELVSDARLRRARRRPRRRARSSCPASSAGTATTAA